MSEEFRNIEFNMGETIERFRLFHDFNNNNKNLIVKSGKREANVLLLNILSGRML